VTMRNRKKYTEGNEKECKRKKKGERKAEG
jgi:hypothetical protein